MTTTRETKGFDFTNIIVYSSAILGAIVGGFVVCLFFTGKEYQKDETQELNETFCHRRGLSLHTRVLTIRH